MRSLAPTDVTVGSRGDVERNHAVAWTASIVCHDAIVVIEVLVDLVDHSVRV